MKKLSILFVVAIFTILACKKESVFSSKEENVLKSAKSDMQILGEYTKILTLAFKDVIEDEQMMDLIIQSVTAQSNLGDEYDYKEKMSTIEELFTNESIDLEAILINSIENYSTNPEGDVAEFLANKYSMELGDYLHEFAIFIPALNQDIEPYKYVDMDDDYKLGTILYNRTNEGQFPVFNNATNSFTLQNTSIVDDEPFVLVSALISMPLDSEFDFNEKAYEACGRCDESNTTNWCEMRGKGCKCTASSEPLPFN